MYCPTCGAVNKDGAKYCCSCGSSLNAGVASSNLSRQPTVSPKDKKTMKGTLIVLRLIAIVMLILAFIGGFPISFYMLVRWVVFVTCGIVAAICCFLRRYVWAILYAICAVIFNPFLPLYLGRDIWKLVDVYVGLFLLISLGAFHISEKKPDARQQ